MVRQEDVDNLFAKPGTARRHCMMVSACIVFDVAIYPLMIYFLFIDVPDFLKSPSGQEEKNMVLLIKLAAMCGFTFVVCMYQVILFDLFGQHCSRMRETFSPSKTVPSAPANMETERSDEWNHRQEEAGHGLPSPGHPDMIHEEATAMMLPGATSPSRMPVIEEDPYAAGATTVQVNFQRGGARAQSLNNIDERGKGQAFVQRFHSEDHVAGSRSSSSMVEPAATLDGRCHVCSNSADMASLTPLSDGHLVCTHCRPSKKGGASASCRSTAGKHHEKTVSFDRETVFTYIKQTPVQTPR